MVQKMSTVRDGRKVWPYCLFCGCRLELTLVGDEGKYFVEHYRGNDWVRDARNHSCDYIASTWIIDGGQIYG